MMMLFRISWKKRKATRCCSFVMLDFRVLNKLAVAALNCGDEGIKVSSVTHSMMCLVRSATEV